MKDTEKAPLRGEAAWRAEVKEIARRNDAARAAGAHRRAVQVKQLLREAAERERRESKGLRDSAHR
ncbi:MAG TPA: hypothetical protein VFZ00_16310 [Solirubrobacter sp.]|nr:hypothetical protein [Solirubrobacter sp.]